MERAASNRLNHSGASSSAGRLAQRVAGPQRLLSRSGQLTAREPRQDGHSHATAMEYGLWIARIRGVSAEPMEEGRSAQCPQPVAGRAWSNRPGHSGGDLRSVNCLRSRALSHECPVGSALLVLLSSRRSVSGDAGRPTRLNQARLARTGEMLVVLKIPFPSREVWVPFPTVSRAHRGTG